MKDFKTVKMHRWRALFLTNLFAVVAIWFLNIFWGMTYDSKGSFDIVIGSFIEVLILSAYFEFLNARGQKNLENHLQAHLRQIESLINDNKPK
jgi:hypothetical protein